MASSTCRSVKPEHERKKCADLSLQTIHPLNNHYAVQIESHGTGKVSQALWLAGLLEVTLVLELFLQRLVSIESSLSHKPASQFSRLERSMAASQGLAIPADGTEPLHGLLYEYGKSMAASINHQMAFGHGDQVSDDSLLRQC